MENKYTDNVFNINIADNSTTYHNTDAIVENDTSSVFKDMLAIPNWGIEDFLKERMKYRLQGTQNSQLSKYAEPSTYFYKLFFNFNTGQGLLGSTIYSPNDKMYKEENTAYQYLTNLISSPRFSDSYKAKLEHKRDCLAKFTWLLNYLVNECPWFFKEITGLTNAMKINFDNIINKEQNVITIKFNKDAVDMRIEYLFDLYREVCYDYENFKEILPDNLRKFDMCLLIFNPPINGLNVSLNKYEINNEIARIDNGESIFGKFRTDVDTNNSETLSGLTFRAIILKNCEINLNSSTSVVDSLNNEQGFEQELSMDINYDRSYVYAINNELNIQIISDFMK